MGFFRRGRRDGRVAVFRWRWRNALFWGWRGWLFEVNVLPVRGVLVVFQRLFELVHQHVDVFDVSFLRLENFVRNGTELSPVFLLQCRITFAGIWCCLLGHTFRLPGHAYRLLGSGWDRLCWFLGRNEKEAGCDARLLTRAQVRCRNDCWNGRVFWLVENHATKHDTSREMIGGGEREREKKETRKRRERNVKETKREEKEKRRDES
jgi:hypothetical protein